ncbi:MAG TPA: hypothetical protein VGO50_09495 [Pyrinomonadaceae bacterium]|jgi:hypothetical protein|nr:hypothetical protein [Pyrinomonadaceae bacterium]
MQFSRFVFACLFLLAPSVFIFAQETRKENKDSVQWNRIRTADGELSIEMPSNQFYFYDKDGFALTPTDGSPYVFAEMHQLIAFAGKTVMRIEIYTPSKPKACFEEIIDSDHIQGTKTKETLPGFTIRQIQQQNIARPQGKDIEISHITKYIVSNTRLYVISVANLGARTEESKRFLSSIRLNTAKPAENAPEKAPEKADEKIISISDLKPLTIDQIVLGRETEDISPPPKPTAPQPAAANTLSSLVILSKPAPTFTKAARESVSSGVLRLRLLFSQNGSISKVWFLNSLPAGLNRNCFFSAIRLRFLPAEKAEGPVSLTKMIEYNFASY